MLSASGRFFSNSLIFCLQRPEVMASSLPLLVLLLCCVGVALSDLRVSRLSARGLRKGVSEADGYVKVYCVSRYLGETNVIRNNPNPYWSQTFSYSDARANDRLELRVYDQDPLFDDEVGRCYTRLRRGNHWERCSLRKGGTLYFSYSFS
uniref:C2 domain-containing protein n=1 Tax=Cyprinodon variegatus TaxID=28743 RepID=A0A3Q2D7U9_CYPVA